MKGLTARLVALVDDDASVCRAMARLLRSAGFEAGTFASAEEFLAFAHPESVGSVVLDLGLPGMSGVDLLRRLRASGQSIPVVCMTAEPDSNADLAELVFRAGARAILYKPFDPKKLLELLQPDEVPRTLGDMLYADKAKTRVPEKDWVGLVAGIAAGDQLALWALFERTNGVAFTLISRIVNVQESAEELTVDTFHDVWELASSFDPNSDTVVGWVMNLARSRALRGWRSPLQTRVEAGANELLARMAPSQWAPEWEDVAPGISCELLATDAEHARVSMLVRLAPGVDYPPHRHAGVEEVHLLDGELWIDSRKLCPGDYSRAEAGTTDNRVWSETGCTCVLITSTRDAL